MPSLNDIATVAEALEKSALAIVQDRCVVVRNRNATCRRCVQACPTHAIEVSNNEVHLAASSCISCGACVAVCPTEAIVPLEPTDEELANAAYAALRENGNRAVFACARIASKRQANPARYAVVPCLARLDEGIIAALVARGADEVLLVDGDCTTCKYRDCISHADATIAEANHIMAAQGCSVEAQRITGFPDDMLAEDIEGLHGTTRRGFFSDAVGAARDTAMVAAKSTLAQELGYTDKPVSIGERLRVTEEGTLPLIQVPRHEAAINAMYELGEPVVDEIESRLFASISVEVQRCNACGMCVMFCPTGALRRDPTAKVGDPLTYLEFSASDCINCGLCADVCWKRALTLSPSVSTAELFDFEPKEFDLSSAQFTPNSPFGK